MSGRRNEHNWWLDVFLPALCLLGLFVKVRLIEGVISQSSFVDPNVALGTLLSAIALVALALARTQGLTRFWFAWTVNAIGTAIALVDLWHFRFYGDVAAAADLFVATQLPLVIASVEALTKLFDWFMLLDLGALAAVMLFTWPYFQNSPAKRSLRPLLASGLLFAVTSGAIGHAVWTDDDDTLNSKFTRKSIVRMLGLAGYHTFDLVSEVLYPIRGRIALLDHTSEIQDLLESRQQERVASPLAGIAHGRNVLLISAESLQSFALELDVNGGPLMPHLRAFAKDSLQFTSFYDQTNLGTTSDAEFLALNSLLPLSSGAVATRYASNTFRSLPHVLREAGYTTFSACGEPPAFWNMSQIHARYGFEHSRFLNSMKLTEWVGAGLDDAEFFRQMLPQLSNQGSPFFAFLLTSSNHHPYTLPKRLQRLSPAPLQGSVAGDYLQSLRYFDDAFGQLFKELAERRQLENTVIVIYGDHRAHLEPAELQQLWRLQGHTSDATSFDLWQMERRVPLLVRLPAGEAAGIRDVPGGHLDIASTVLSILGIKNVPSTWLGRDLTAPSARAVAFRDGSVTTGEASAIVGPRGNAACYTRTGAPMSCDPLAPARADTERQFWASYQIVSGNLVPALRQLLDVANGMPPRALPPFVTIAHRGDSKRFPENTLASLRSAASIGADLVEIDLRLTRDGVPMVFHDESLEGTTDGEGLFGDFSAEQIKKLDAGRKFSPQFAGERVPTLEEALRTVNAHARLYLDLKVSGLAKPIAATYASLGIPQERALVAVWTEEQRLEFQRAMPGAELIWVTEAPAIVGRDYFVKLRESGFKGIEFGERWPAGVVGEAVAAGMPVYAFTVNDAATMRRLREIGVSGIESDDPSLLQQVVRSPRAVVASPTLPQVAANRVR